MKAWLKRTALELLKMCAILAAAPVVLYALRVLLQLFRGDGMEAVMASSPVFLHGLLATLQLLLGFDTAIGQWFLIVFGVMLACELINRFREVIAILLVSSIAPLLILVFLQDPLIAAISFLVKLHVFWPRRSQDDGMPA